MGINDCLFCLFSGMISWCNQYQYFFLWLCRRYNHTIDIEILFVYITCYFWWLQQDMRIVQEIRLGKHKDLYWGSYLFYFKPKDKV